MDIYGQLVVKGLMICTFLQINQFKGYLMMNVYRCRTSFDGGYIAARPTADVTRYRVKSISRVLYFALVHALSHFCLRKIVRKYVIFETFQALLYINCAGG